MLYQNCKCNKRCDWKRTIFKDIFDQWLTQRSVGRRWEMNMIWEKEIYFIPFTLYISQCGSSWSIWQEEWFGQEKESTNKTRDFRTLRSRNPSGPLSCITPRTVPRATSLLSIYPPRAFLHKSPAADPNTLLCCAAVVLSLLLISKSGIPWIRWSPPPTM